MEVFFIVLKQVITMGLLIAVGFALTRLNVIGKEAGKTLSAILSNIIIPSVIIAAFTTLDTSADSFKFLILTIVLSYAALLSSMWAACLIYRKGKSEYWAAKRNFITFTNDGFFGIPVIQALFGATGVIIASIHVTCMNTLTWTWGGSQLRKEQQNGEPMHFKDILKLPSTVAAFIGIVIFLIRVLLDRVGFHSTFAAETLEPVLSTLDFLKAMNTPLAMMIVGVNVAGATGQMKGAIRKSVAPITIRQIFLPLIQLLLLMLLPIDKILAFSIFVIEACPCAMIISVMTVQYGSPEKETDYAVSTVIIATLSALVTLPVMVAIGNLILPIA